MTKMNKEIKKYLKKKVNYGCFTKSKSKVCDLFKVKLLNKKIKKNKNKKNKNKKNNKQELYDVIVIGAGVAGLTASRNLTYNGKKVLILEGRDRIGGRIHDIKTKNMGELHLGASWLHYKGKYHILEDILKYYKVKYFNDDSLESNETMGIYEKEWLKDKENAVFSKILMKLPKNIKKYGKLYPNKSVSEIVHIINKKKGWKYSEDLINSLIVRSFEHCSMNADIMNAKEFDGWEPNGKFMKDGFGKMIKKMSIGLNIKLNHVVKKIKQIKQIKEKGNSYSVSTEKKNEYSCVKVETNKGVYKAKYVISTLPIGVLQSGNVKFIPGLPETKKKALKNLFSGSHEKIFLKFPYVFWDKNMDVFQYSTNKNRGVCTQWYNILKKAENKNILFTNISGPDIRYAKKSNIELKNICMKILRKMFGQSIPNPTGIYVTRWSLDKFTLGGPYAHPNKNGTMEDLSIVGCPFGRIHFGGVDTSKNETETVEAAILSGLRTSNEILNKNEIKLNIK